MIPFVPDNTPLPQALERITHLGIGAHQDDLEFMAFHGIISCLNAPTQWFGGVTCTNGSGSARSGSYSQFTDAEMQEIRKTEQNQAALLGQYGAMFQLGHSSQTIKSPSDSSLKKELRSILESTRPEIVYTHNPADKHDTHIAVCIATLEAIRELPADLRPRQVIGCEVWRGLDWLCDSDKVIMDVSGHDALAHSLNAVFASQIAGGKRYDLATIGRRSANATFFDSHTTDQASQVIFGIDLTPVAHHPEISIHNYIHTFLQKFQNEILNRIPSPRLHDSA